MRVAFAGVDGVTVEQVEAYRIRQTGLHFHRCRNVAITGARATDVGWSGISSSQTDDLTLRDVHVRRSGLDTVHSAIHIGGGERIFVEVDADESTGNAVMLDSRAAPLSRAVVMGSGRAAKRGVALIGHDHPLTHVHVTGAYVQNRETGILVSNAEDVYVVGAELVDNPLGVVLQGRRGARRCMVAGCRITGSHVAILERRWNCDNVIIA